MVSEPVFITTHDFGPYRYRNNTIDRGGQYITFCYVGQIPADAVRPTHLHPKPISVLKNPPYATLKTCVFYFVD
jgi:hypothetical protein